MRVERGGGGGGRGALGKMCGSVRVEPASCVWQRRPCYCRSGITRTWSGRRLKGDSGRSKSATIAKGRRMCRVKDGKGE